MNLDRLESERQFKDHRPTGNNQHSDRCLCVCVCVCVCVRERERERERESVWSACFCLDVCSDLLVLERVWFCLDGVYADVLLF